MSFAFGRRGASGQRRPLLTHVNKTPEANPTRKKHTESHTSGISGYQDSQRLMDHKKASVEGLRCSQAAFGTSTGPRSGESARKTVASTSGDSAVFNKPKVDMSVGGDSGGGSYRAAASGFSRSESEIQYGRKKTSTISRRNSDKIEQIYTRSTKLGDSERLDQSKIHDADDSIMTDQFGSIYLSSDEKSSVTSSGPSTLTDLTTYLLNETMKTEETCLLAKRLIYKKYLQAYVPSMLSIPNKRITILDIFSGTGRAKEHSWPMEIESYETPIIALRVALHHFKKKGKEDVHFNNEGPSCADAFLDGIEHLKKNTDTKIEINSSDKHKVVLIFVEGNKDLYKELIKTVITVIKMYGLRVDRDGKFEEGICKVLCDFRGTDRTNNEYIVACYIVHTDISQVDPPSGNCLTVFDFHDDTSLPLETVRKFTGPQKQVFISLNSKMGSLNSSNSGLVASSINREGLYSHLSANELNYFEQTLKQKSKANLTLAMDMQGKAQKIECHFLFVASYFQSFTYMKESMYNVGQAVASVLVSSFRNLRRPSEEFTSTEMAIAQPNEFTTTDMAVADTIYRRFRGTEVLMSEIERYIWFETPYLFRKTPLKILEKQGKLRVQTEDKKRRKGTFSDTTDWNFVFRS